jgi:hypothetical protein
MHLLQKHSFTFTLKTLKLVKNIFCKRRHYKNPTCFGHYSMAIFRGRPSFLVHPPPISRLLRHLSFLGFVTICPLFVCVPNVPVCVLSGRVKHDQTTHRQAHRAHIQAEGIRPQTPKKTNEEAGSHKVVNALGTENDP